MFKPQYLLAPALVLSAYTATVPAATTVPLSRPQVRVIYAVPSNRSPQSGDLEAVKAAVAEVREWYRGQMGGATYRWDGTVKTCALPKGSAAYRTHTWSRVVGDLQACAPVQPGGEGTDYVVFADVLHDCGDPERLGAGQPGLTLLPRQDLDGLTGRPYFDDCGVKYDLPPGRYVGGLAHEIGHSFGLRHPPGCDERAPECDVGALMDLGYAAFPQTYLRDDDKRTLRESLLFR